MVELSVGKFFWLSPWKVERIDLDMLEEPESLFFLN